MGLGEDFLARGKAHFARGEKELKYVDVPEFPDDDGNPTRIYFRPVSPMDEKGQILEAGRSDQTGYLIEYLIRKARNAEGERIFKSFHKKILRQYIDSDVLNRIVLEMQDQIGQVSPEEAEEELKKTLSSEDSSTSQDTLAVAQLPSSQAG